MTAAAEIEIGTVRDGEMDTFLAVMCEAFHMDFRAAKPIFYSDPYLDPQNKFVLRLDGTIVSCLTAVDRECWIGDATVRVAGIAGVSTRQEFRRRGFAGQLIKETVRTLTARGYQLAALFPEVRQYYRRFGWETAGVVCTSRKLAPETSGRGERAVVRRATEDDLQAVSELYDRTASGRCMHCRRDGKRWSYLLTYVPHSYVACGPSGDVEGYLLYDLLEETGSASSAPPSKPSVVLRVHEMVGGTARARLSLRHYLRSQRLGGSLEASGPPETLVQNGFVAPAEAYASFMARVLDWAALTTALTPNWRKQEGELGTALIDPILSRTPRAVAIRCESGSATAAEIDPAELSALPRGFLVGEVSAWSAVAAGHYSARTACERGTLKASSAQAAELAERLFPARAPFIPPVDHF